MSLLEVKDLSIRFGGLQALKDVSFGVEKGSFLGLMGPNGAGKTTVINCISKIYPFQNGKIFFEGNDITNIPSHEMSKIGITRTFQDLNFYLNISDLSVIDYLMLGQFQMQSRNVLADGFRFGSAKKSQDQMKKNARKILEFLADFRESLELDEERDYPILYGRGGFPNLLDVEYSSIASLSFAWRRRLDLARALVSNPQLLLLDEPSQGLAPSEVDKLGNLLRQIKTEFGTAAIIVEHSVKMLMSISDKIVVMNAGEKIAEGLPEEINNHPEVIRVYLGNSKDKNTESETNSDQKISADTAKADETKAIKMDSTNKNQDMKNLEPVLELQNIDLFYGQAQALSSVSMKFYPGHVYCVLGTNGSGKSTLLKAIGGTEKPSLGQILLEGQYLPMGVPEIAVERGIQYVQQGHVIFPRLTVYENLRVGAYAYEKKGKKPDFDKVFHYFEPLKKMLDLQANDLSGGQQQMLAIAQALMGQPKVLMLDEPSLGLSPRYVELIFDIIQKISKEEKCMIVLVEQNVTKSLEICDYCFMMNSGVLISHGPSSMYKENFELVKKNLGFV